MSQRLVEQNRKLISQLTDENHEDYFHLPHYLDEFQYPVSLETGEGIGDWIYKKESADAVQFVAIMATKMYTWIINSSKRTNILEEFMHRENKKIRRKTSKLIRSVKLWERSKVNDEELAEAIESFCKETFGVRLPVISFFLRMLRPNRFATLDVRATEALKRLGFIGIKDIPQEQLDIGKYLKKYSGLDYLAYNGLLTEIGKHYTAKGPNGEVTHMIPAEVDMALYYYDKISGPALLKQRKTSLVQSEKAIQSQVMNTHEACDAILKIIEEIFQGACEVAQEDWAIKTKKAGKIRGSAAKLQRYMQEYARKGDLEAMYHYYQAAMSDRNGASVGRILQDQGKKSLESEYLRAKTIYESAITSPK